MISYRFRMYSNAARFMVLSDTIDLCGRLHNTCIRSHKCYRKYYKKHLSAFDLMKHITRLKKRSGYAWIKLIPSQSAQDVVERIDKAYKLYYRNKKHGIQTSKPGYKKIEKYKSFTLKQVGYKFLEGNKIRIGKRVYKYIKSREIEGNVKTVTIKRDNIGNLWLIVVTDYERSEIRQPSGNSVGFDFGMKHFLVGSDGTIIDAPLFLKSQYKERRKLNRALSRKKTGSNHRKQAKLRLAKFHQRIENQRNDYQWKLASILVSKYDLICLEDLSLKWMSKHFGKKIGDYGFYSFRLKLDYLAEVFGKQIGYADRFFPSSKTCSNCGYIKQDLKLKDRHWVCPVCGAEHDRDFNASVNILREGASSLGLDRVRPKPSDLVSLGGGICCLIPESPML